MRDPCVDPTLFSLLDNLRPFNLSDATLAATRESASAALLVPGGVLPQITMEELRVPPSRRSPGSEILLYRPPVDGPLPIYFHMHGGGFVLGNPRLSDARNRRIADRAHCAVVSVRYRLAPENTFPGPIEDCYAALRWIHEQARALGLDGERIAIGGESAGGGLAAALAILARDRGEFRIGMQMLTYPMLDDRTVLDQRLNDRHFHVWTPADNEYGWRSMLGRRPTKGKLSPYAAPARLRNHVGLPSAFMAIGSIDLFLRENLNYAGALTDAGVPVELLVYPGAFHGFILSTTSPLARRYEREFTNALKRAFE